MFKKRKVAKTAARTVKDEKSLDPVGVASVQEEPVKAEPKSVNPESPEAPPDSDGELPQDEPPQQAANIPDGAYKGLKKASSRFGPIAASKTIRSTVVTDYQPDVCKDYKQTGYCGYGDSCKFLHIRENYAAGWQLDNPAEPAAPAPARWAPLRPGKDKKEPLKEVDPDHCAVCEKPPTVPVKTRCGHLYCEACFFAAYKKTASCVVCGQDTGGLVKRVK